MDASFPEPPDLLLLSNTLDRMPGIVGHSLFPRIASKAIIAREQDIQILERT